MTIQNQHGFEPTTSVYPSPVNTLTTPPSFGTAYARYLRLHADTFDPSTSADEELTALLRAENEALLAVAATPVNGIEEFAIKLRLLQSQLEAAAPPHSVSMLMGAMIADLRNV